jgi:copper oxidase (laccase) domain-containing protein
VERGKQHGGWTAYGAEGTITTLHTTTLLQRKSVTHAFSTKVGGVSPLAQRVLSLGSTSHDFLENIEENHRRFAFEKRRLPQSMT